MMTNVNNKRKLKSRVLLRLMLTAVAAVSAILAIWVTRAEKQHAATLAIVALGGEYQYNTTSCGYGRTDTYFFAPTLAAVFGPDYVYSIVVVDFRDTKITDSDLTVLDNLHSVRVLTLSDSQLGSEGFARVAKMKSLVFLDPSYCDLNSESLKHLSELSNLEALNLNQATSVDDAGLDHVRGIPMLTDLSYIGTSATQ